VDYQDFMMNEHDKFKAECAAEVGVQGSDQRLQLLTHDWILNAAKHKYSYHFEWLGRPIIQHPQDMIGVQQLLWQVKPDLIIETGIARGGSLIYYASLLELIAQCGGPHQSRVIGIDVDIREHNREAILAHPMSKRIDMVQGSSTAQETFLKVGELARSAKNVFVCLDSNHTHEHVLEELRLFAPLVSPGSYCVVFDTIIADMPPDSFPDRAWTKSRNPKSAVYEYLQELQARPTKGADGTPLQFRIDKHIEQLLLISVAPDGFLRRE
jgi:cephalosporin hydroxylase